MLKKLDRILLFRFKFKNIVVYYSKQKYIVLDISVVLWSNLVLTIFGCLSRLKNFRRTRTQEKSIHIEDLTSNLFNEHCCVLQY